MAFEFNFDGKNVKFEATTANMKKLDEAGIRYQFKDPESGENVDMAIPGTSGEAWVAMAINAPTKRRVASVLFNLQKTDVLNEHEFADWLQDNKGEKTDELLEALGKLYERDIADTSL